jgi:hypothetical protein
MWMWQSVALSGAFSRGGSVPEEFGTACAVPARAVVVMTSSSSSTFIIVRIDHA